jgi:hypothetical protein
MRCTTTVESPVLVMTKADDPVQTVAPSLAVAETAMV